MPDYVAYLKINGITGGGPNGEIEIDSWSFGVSNSGSVGPSGGVEGKTSLSDLTITKPVDSSSSALFKAALSGTSIPSVVLVVISRTSGSSGSGTGGEYFMVTFSEVLISNYKVDQHSGGNPGPGEPTPCPPSSGGGPKESISFVFGQVAIQYQQQN